MIERGRYYLLALAVLPRLELSAFGLHAIQRLLPVETMTAVIDWTSGLVNGGSCRETASIPLCNYIFRVLLFTVPKA